MDENEILESESVDETSSLDSVSDNVSNNVDTSVQNSVESTEDYAGSDSVDFPDDYLDVQTFNDGVDRILDAVEETEEVVNVNYAVSTMALSDPDIPYNAVTFDCDGIPIYFPSNYAEDVSVIDGELLNFGSNYTFGIVLDDSGLSNYVSSEITVPTYHSATWYQYQASYGQPYRIVDRYINDYGSLSSSTRDFVSLEFSGGNDWAGWSYGLIFAIICVFLLIFREVRSCLML